MPKMEIRSGKMPFRGGGGSAELLKDFFAVRYQVSRIAFF